MVFLQSAVPSQPAAPTWSDVPPSTRAGGLPAVGWTRIAMALAVTKADPTATAIRFHLDDGATLLVDLVNSSVLGIDTPDQLGDEPRVLRALSLRGGFAPTALDERPLDALLWHAGLRAFHGRPAQWLDAQGAVRLVRWPNLTVLPHGPEHVRMAALLANAAMDAPTLARVARVDEHVAQMFVNACSLMGLLQESTQHIPLRPIPTISAAEPREGGLFRRLLERWRR